MSLTEAARRGDLQEVQRLVNQGVDIHAQDDLALIRAAGSGHLQVVEFLVNHGADIHARNDQVLINTSYGGYLPVVKFLLRRGANFAVLSPEFQRRYQHLVPLIISTFGYYQLEPNIEEVQFQTNRYILRTTRNETYVLMT